MTLTLGHRVRVIVPDALETTIDDGLVMLSVDRGAYYNFNRLGSVIWEMIKAEELTGAEVCDRLQQRFAVDRAQCEQETLMFLERLLVQQLIRVV